VPTPLSIGLPKLPGVALSLLLPPLLLQLHPQNSHLAQRRRFNRTQFLVTVTMLVSWRLTNSVFKWPWSSCVKHNVQTMPLLFLRH
jgi:hypothetical protein